MPGFMILITVSERESGRSITGGCNREIRMVLAIRGPFGTACDVANDGVRTRRPVKFETVVPIRLVLAGTILQRAARVRGGHIVVRPDHPVSQQSGVARTAVVGVKPDLDTNVALVKVKHRVGIMMIETRYNVSRRGRMIL